MTSVRTQVSGDGLGRSGQDIGQDLTRQFARERSMHDPFGAAAGQQRDVRRQGEREPGAESVADRGRGHSLLADRAEQFEQVLAEHNGKGSPAENRSMGRDGLDAGQEETAAPDAGRLDEGRLSASMEGSEAAAMQAAGHAASAIVGLASVDEPPVEAKPSGRAMAAVETLIERVTQASRDGFLLPGGQMLRLRIPLDADGPLAAAQVALTPHSIEIVLAPGAAGASESLIAAARDLRERLASRFPNRRVSVDAGENEAPSATGGLAAIATLLGRARGEGQP